MFLFLEGEFDVEILGVCYYMKLGDVGFVFCGMVYVFKNVGLMVGKLCYILLLVGIFEDFILFVYVLFIDGMDCVVEILVLVEKYGMEMVGLLLE